MELNVSLRLPSSVFVHIPRTGGIWFGEALRRIGLMQQILTGDLDSHLPYSQMPPPWNELPGFAFVRHPWAWVKSRWSHCLEHRLRENGRNFYIHREFNELVDSSLIITLENILEKHPGIVGETFREMTTGVTALYRTRGLPHLAVVALKRFESITEEQEQLILTLPAINSTSGIEKYQEQIEQVPTPLVESFLESETEALKLWEQAE